MLDAISKWAPRGYLDVTRVVAGNLARQFLRGVFKLLAAGFLTPQAFGVVRATWSLFRITVSFADLGVDYASVALGAAALGRDDPTRQRQLEQVTLTIKLVLSGVVLVIGNLMAPHVARLVLGDPGLEPYVRLVFLAVSGQLFWRYVVNHLTTHQQFGRLARYLVTMPLLMLAVAVALIAAGRFDRTTCLLIYLFAPGITALVWLVLLRGRLPLRPRWNPEAAGSLLRFGRWIYATGLASAGRNHLNALLLKNPRFSGTLAAGELNTGLYAFGADLAGEITVISKSLASVLLPKAAKLNDPANLRRFVRRSYLHLAWLIVPLGLLVFAARPLLLLLGQLRGSFLEYLPSLSVFAILYLGNLLSLVSIPMQTALYSMGQPQVETWIEVVGFVILVVGALVLIPRHGAEGAAFAVLAQRIVSFTALMGYGTRSLRRYTGSAA